MGDDEPSWLMLMTVHDLAALMAALESARPEWVDTAEVQFGADDERHFLVIALAESRACAMMNMKQVAEIWLLEDQAESIQAIYNVARRLLH